MFDFIKGTLEEELTDSIVIENQGLAFNVYISKQTSSKLPKIGSLVKIYLHMNVKENDVTLYGFLTTKEREIYRKLISVSGIGPKVAMGVLSVHNTNDIIWSIIGEDIVALTKAPGVGKKTAQRMILELKDKLTVHQGTLTNDTEKSSKDRGSRVEVVEALVALGYQPSQAHKAVTEVHKDGLPTETLIKKALKMLSSN